MELYTKASYQMVVSLQTCSEGLTATKGNAERFINEVASIGS